jgi:hypothetical protein
MLQVPTSTSTAPGSAGVADSPSASEKSATSPVSSSSLPAPSSASASAPKLRSCVVCRSRKVRCDKLSPCSNCRRANIVCVLPSANRPPRWARRLGRATNVATSGTKTTQEDSTGFEQVVERVHYLEGLVKELGNQLELANAAARSTEGGSPSTKSPGDSSHDRDADHHMDSFSTASDAAGIQKQFGRLVLQDASRGRYVSSGFWSRVNDEVR